MTTALPNPPAQGAASPLAEHDALPAGTRFGEFEILRVLGVGGFGIVYLAQDHSLERLVALKEYMPASLAARGVGPAITVRSGSFAETYAVGLRSFINEARLLARFDHPSLVKVYRFWEDNATAYMVMPYLQGTTLRDARRAMRQSPDEAWIRGVLMPMLSALDLLHREGVYHRDIAPDNILLPPETPPILLDFGAARRVISDRTQSLTAILKPSYAPIEQYAEMTQLRQGPWTDLYALGAVMHFLLFGQPPAPATARAIQDKHDGFDQRQVPGVSPRFMAIVGWMLAVRPNERPQSVEALRAALDGRTAVPEPTRRDVTVPGDTALLSVAPAPFEKTVLVGTSHAAPTQVDTSRQPTELHRGRAPIAMPTAVQPRPPISPAADAERPRIGLVVGALLATAVVAMAVFWFAMGDRREAPIASDAASAAAATQAAVAASDVAAPPLPISAVAPTDPVAASGSAPSSVAASAPPVVSTLPASAPALSPAAAAAAASAAKARQIARAAARASEAVAAGARSADVAAAVVPPPAVAMPPSDSATATQAMVAAAEPATAREACGKRVFIALAVCMDRECEQPRYRDNPECVKVLEIKRRRERQ